jgi:hypothetical protein
MSTGMNTGMITITGMNMTTTTYTMRIVVAAS